MNELVKRISSYDLVNNLLPGALFVFIGQRITSYQLGESNFLVTLFLYYFVGLVISRFGALVIEPIARKTFLPFVSYRDFVAASGQDPMLQTISEVRNMYRSLISLILALGALRGYEWLSERSACVASVGPWVGVLGLLLLFLFSYRRQAGYLCNRAN